MHFLIILLCFCIRQKLFSCEMLYNSVIRNFIANIFTHSSSSSGPRFQGFFSITIELRKLQKLCQIISFIFLISILFTTPILSNKWLYNRNQHFFSKIFSIGKHSNILEGILDLLFDWIRSPSSVKIDPEAAENSYFPRYPGRSTSGLDLAL